ncbi:ABC transporter ATP-binding protein [Chamaesiphon sp.]|uniref:ABC transporter ATP-binding protein n=1 Tax=Chamaesiphon sp. TaxID=2814140 RepID=UPI00359372F3
MSDTVVQVENLSKKYIIGHQKQESYTTLRDSITNGAKGLLKPFQRDLSQVANSTSEEFWALKDVSFDIKQGDRVGIIGKNGAGKSTLLKILSRIVEPTSGQIKIKGRVASLLEVGTGFHPELTGRENIALNGAILGMSKVEIDRKFDEIVAFAEIEKFLDTPVKRYSSGMYVRLAFSVAAHLEPEILIVDEVLAVGDAQFQKKCMGKMEYIAEKEGRTILFVSHNISAIQRLCSSAVFLKEGKVFALGESQKVVDFYLKQDLKIDSYRDWEGKSSPPGNQFVSLLQARVVDKNLKTTSCVKITEEVGIEMTYKVLRDEYVFTHGLNLYDEQGVHIFSSHDRVTAQAAKSIPKGIHTIIAWIPGNLLAEGMQIVGLALMQYNPYEVIFHEQEALAFDVMDVFDNTSARGMYEGAFPGLVRPILEWNYIK